MCGRRIFSRSVPSFCYDHWVPVSINTSIIVSKLPLAFWCMALSLKRVFLSNSHIQILCIAPTVTPFLFCHCFNLFLHRVWSLALKESSNVSAVQTINTTVCHLEPQQRSFVIWILLRITVYHGALFNQTPSSKPISARNFTVSSYFKRPLPTRWS